MPNSAAPQLSLRQRQTRQTRDAIMQAAETLFTTRGYGGVGVREIANEAGVNLALISRHFGSKLMLFDAVLQRILTSEIFIPTDRSKCGDYVANMVCGATRPRVRMLGALVMSAGDEAAREVSLRVICDQVLAPLERWFDNDDAHYRAVQVTLVLTGLFTYRDLLPLASLQPVVSEKMVKWLSRTLQDIVDSD